MGDNLGGLDVLGDDDEFSDPSLYRLRRLIRALPHFARPRGLPQYLVGCFGYFLRRLELHVVRLGGHLKNRPLTARYPRYLRVGRSGEFGARISTETRGGRVSQDHSFDGRSKEGKLPCGNAQPRTSRANKHCPSPRKVGTSLTYLCASTQVSRESTLQNQYLMNWMICPRLRSRNDSSTSPFVVTRLFLFTEPSSL